MAILDDIKKELRVNGIAFDTEVGDLIASAKLDLKLAGILQSKIDDTTDALIKRAIALYCKSNFGMFGDDAEKFAKPYYHHKESLSLSADYTVEVVV